MLNRARRLQPVLDLYCTEHQYLQFKLEKEEWRQIDYLLCITEPFFTFTTTLSKSKDITIHLIFGIYNKLFTHIEASEAQLQRKRVPWKRTMLNALCAAREKLSQYYTATDSEAYGDIYAIATILAPSKKLKFFTTKDWQGHDYVKQYQECIEREFRLYKHRLSKENASVTAEASEAPLEFDNPIEMLVDSQTHLQIEGDQDNDDELARYLAKGLYSNLLMLFNGFPLILI